MKRSHNNVIVVGGGIAGLSAATAVADIGLDIVLVDRDKYLGGHAAEWACMATDACAQCSACLVHDQIQKTVRHPRIQVILGGEVVSCRGEIGDYRLALEPVLNNEPKQEPWSKFALDSRREVSGGCVVLATGFEVYDTSENPLLGYGQLEGVVTTRDLDHILREDNLTSFLPEDGQPLHLAFIQCVGSRDRKSGREYCSQFCCRTTIRLANRLLYLKPEIQVTVFYIDLQIMSKDFIAFYRQAQEKIRFIQGVPAEVTQGDERPLRLFSVVPGSDRVEALEFDRVVLAIGVSPTLSHGSLARTFDIGLNEFGYFDADIATADSGVFPVGGCAGPSDIQGSRKQALAVAARVARWMESRSILPESARVFVDTHVAPSTRMKDERIWNAV